MKHSSNKLFLKLVVLVFALMFATPLIAQANDTTFIANQNGLTAGQVSITLITGDNGAGLQKLISDSNNCTGGDGPHAAYIGFRVTNTSGGVLSGLTIGVSA